MQNGEFTEHLINQTHDIEFKEILERFPQAVSITSRYRNSNQQDIVEVHYYIQYPGGPILPGMRPDPKLLFEDGVFYHKEKLKDRTKRLASG